jgi:hypothetical protein
MASPPQRRRAAVLPTKGSAADRDELLSRFAAVPNAFPRTKRYAAELTSGTALDRFAFTLDLIVGGLHGRA